MASVLKNSLLQLTIEEPGKVYLDSRFDRTGNISRVLFENRFGFCSAETIREFDAKRHGQGFYNEFGITRAVGYDDCGIGEKFPKIGVGLLTKESNEKYNFSHHYEINPFDIQMETGDTRIRYTVMPQDCRGYSNRLIKTITLIENSFTIDYELENTGTRKIQTNEYCHNFIAINGLHIGKDYSLRLPCLLNDPAAMVEAVNPENAVILDAHSLKFNFTPEKDFFYSPLTEFHSQYGEWVIFHDKLSVGIKESTDFVPEMMNVWGMKHVISPELFINIDLEPGQKLKWQRRYTFRHL